ncbi:MAG TPA: tetratricopeptide repeat protein [Rhodospirillales bacterium]|nr:tetratricopeptide repeat protein [Rhodospirillales bacterium]
MIRLVVIFVALLQWPAYGGQDDPRLEPLFQTLAHTNDTAEALNAERQIWNMWLRSGDQNVNAEMARGVALLNVGDLAAALRSFDKVIALEPEFAEGWNKRATVYYAMGELQKSVLDIERTVALEPRHFGAFSGLGLIYLAIGDDRAALKAFERVQAIHPRFGDVAAQVERLRQKIKGRAT